jgi:hypothetical protein
MTRKAVPESLQHLHGLLALSLAEQHGFNGKLALEVATACIVALRRAHGGDRLGSRGLYIQAMDDRATRREKIRELMGPSPHSRKRAKQVAMQLNCSEITVWRAVRVEETA